MAIKLNLYNLTQENVNEALEARYDPSHDAGSSCRYSAPCIIGSLLTSAERDSIRDTENDKTQVNVVVHRGVFEFPDHKQASLAFRIQSAFDRGRLAELEDLLKPFDLTIPEEY